MKSRKQKVIVGFLEVLVLVLVYVSCKLLGFGFSFVGACFPNVLRFCFLWVFALGVALGVVLGVVLESWGRLSESFLWPRFSSFGMASLDVARVFSTQTKS